MFPIFVLGSKLSFETLSIFEYILKYSIGHKNLVPRQLYNTT